MRGDAMNRTNRPARELSRRQMLRLAAAGVVGFSTSGWIEALAADAAAHPKRRKSCILLWMTGGPSQTDTFDPKPGHANGGPFKAIETAVPGILISEHLPKLAKQMKDIAIIRSMSTKEGDHGRATFNLRTGYQQTGPIRYPTLGSLVAKELGRGRRRAAELRQHLAGPRLQPGRVRPGLPRPAVCPADRRRARGAGPARRHRRAQPVVQGRGPEPAAGRRQRAGRRPARAAGLVPPGLPVQPPRDRPGQPPGRLPAGRPADAVGGGQGVRAGRGARRRPRRLRPDPVRPGLPAGPPAGRARRAVRRGDALLGRRRRWRSAGTRTSRTSTPSRSSARCSTRLVDPDERPARRAGCSTRR